MSAFFHYAPAGDLIGLVMGGSKQWRSVAELDANGRLIGMFTARLPNGKVVRGPLSDYRQLRPVAPRDLYLTLRQLNNTYQAEQAGLVGRA